MSRFAACAALLLLAGCQGPEPAGSATAIPKPASFATVAANPSAGNTYGEQGEGFRDELLPIEISADLEPAFTDLVIVEQAPEKAYSNAWQFMELSDDGTRVYLSYPVGSGSCDDTPGVQLAQDAERVVIAALVTSTLDEDPEGACTDDLNFAFGWVTLAEPLGGRELWHADLAGDGSQGEGLGSRGFLD
jgi:hypothetical protein